MSQRLSVVRMFNLGTFASMDSITYNWGSRTLLIKAILHNGRYYEVDLGLRPASRFEALLKDKKKAVEFGNALALVLSRATGQTFNCVHHPDRPEVMWFFKYTVCRGG